MTPRKSAPLSLQITANILKTVGPVDEKKFMQPHSVWATTSHLYITDFHNHRLLIYDSLKPQPHDEPRQISRITSSDIPNLNEPSNVVIHNDRLYLADFGNKRLLIFDSPLPENGQTPTIINSISNHQPQTFNSANGLFVTDSAVYMTDSFNNRLIVWDTFRIDSFIGQTQEEDIESGEGSGKRLFHLKYRRLPLSWFYKTQTGQ